MSDWLAHSDEPVLNLSKLTYTCNLDSLCPELPIQVQEIALVPTSAFPTPAQCPHNSCLNTARLQTTFGLTLPHWQQGVARMLQEIL